MPLKPHLITVRQLWPHVVPKLIIELLIHAACSCTPWRPLPLQAKLGNDLLGSLLPAFPRSIGCLGSLRFA